MEDIQSRRDERGVDIDQVGVSGVRYPIVVLDREHGQQHTIAQVSMSVNLPRQFKGTHMSRFIEVLSEHRGEVTMRTLPVILAGLKLRLRAQSARMEVRFPYFIERAAPVSGARALMDYECWFIGEANGIGSDFVLGVRVPVTSLCPCSKAISDYGAHNQRGYVTIELRTRQEDDAGPAIVWIEELVDVAEQSGSAPVYPLLKRVDERHVTMQAYDNPAFVEDVVRNVAVQLQEDPRVAWFSVHATNEESIHNHSAFARIEWRRTQSNASMTARQWVPALAQEAPAPAELATPGSRTIPDVHASGDIYFFNDSTAPRSDALAQSHARSSSRSRSLLTASARAVRYSDDQLGSTVSSQGTIADRQRRTSSRLGGAAGRPVHRWSMTARRGSTSASRSA